MKAARDLANYVGFGAQILRSRRGALRPFKLTWSLTDRCDCRCMGCLIWQKKNEREFTPDEISEVLRAAPSVRWLNLTGGEPTMRADLLEVIEAAHGALPGLSVLDFPTTGQQVDRVLEVAHGVARLGIPRFYITCSVEGPPELHDELRGRPGAFDNMVNTYRGLRALPGVQPYLGMTLTDRNVDQVEATLDAVRAHVPDTDWGDLHFNVYTQSAHYYGNTESDVQAPSALGVAIEKAHAARRRWASPTDRIEEAWLRLLPRYLETGRSPLPCQAMRAGIFIGTGGDVHPCTVYSRVLGNLREASLYDILDGAEAKAAHEVVVADGCPGCWSPCEANPTIVAHAPGSLIR